MKPTLPVIDNMDDTYRIVTELLHAAETGTRVIISPRQAAVLAGKLTKNRTKAAPYLEAAVRQCGGRLHVDTHNLAMSTGDRVKYQPDADAGSGGLLWIAEEEMPV